MLRQHEDSPIANDLSMSPKTRRHLDSTIKQLQSGVMGRARSTLTSLGDVWKPKNGPTQSPPPRNSKSTSPTINRSTLDFFTAWSRHKKTSTVTDENKTPRKKLNEFDMTSTTITSTAAVAAAAAATAAAVRRAPTTGVARASSRTTTSPTKTGDVRNNKNNHDNTGNGTCIGYSNVFNGTTGADDIDVGHDHGRSAYSGGGNGKEKMAHGKHLSLEIFLKNGKNRFGHSLEGMFDKNHNVKHAASKLKKEKRQNVARIMSLDCDKFLEKASEVEMENENNVNRPRRLSDDNISYLDKDDTEGTCRRSWNILTPANEQKRTKVPAEERNRQSIVKGRLKLQKIKATDDIVLNKSMFQTPIKPTSFFRNNSVEAKSLPNRSVFFENFHRDIATPTRKELEKPRKKLSFREPMLCNKSVSFKSDTLPQAEQFLEEYSKRQLAKVREESDDDCFDLDLEVG